MQIERAEVFLVPLRLREPFESSAATVQDRTIVLVALHGDGQTGWGECVAGETPYYSPETTETAWHVLTRFLLPAVVQSRTPKQEVFPAGLLKPQTPANLTPFHPRGERDSLIRTSEVPEAPCPDSEPAGYNRD